MIRCDCSYGQRAPQSSTGTAVRVTIPKYPKVASPCGMNYHSLQMLDMSKLFTQATSSANKWFSITTEQKWLSTNSCGFLPMVIHGYTYTYNLSWTPTYGSHINIWIIPPSGTELGLPQMRGWARALRTSASGSALIMGSFVSQNPHHIWPPTCVVRDGGCSSPKVYAKEC